MSKLSQDRRSTGNSGNASGSGPGLSDALQWHQAGDLKRAEAAYRQILEQEPGNDDALHLLGVLMHQSGQDELAQQLIQAAIQLDPGNDTYYFNLAEVQRACGDPQAAIPNYRKAIEIEAMQADYFFGLGSVLSDCGDPEAAIEVFRKGTLLAPRDPQMHNNLGNALANTGDLDGAIRHFDKALAADPSYAEARVNLGNAHKDNGELECAIADYRDALSLQPEHAEIHYNLAVALDESGMQAQAEEAYRRVLAFDPGMAEAHANLGGLLREMNQLETALQCYRAALELNPRLRSALLGQAAVYRDIGDFEQAARNYRHILGIHVDDVIAHSQLSDCLVKLDCYDQAIEHIDLALRIDPENAEVHFNRGICLQALGRFEEASKSHRKALELKSDLAEAAYNLALISSESLDDADIRQLETLAANEKLDEPARINLYFTLAKAYKDRGRHEQAFTQLQAGNDLKSRSHDFHPETYQDYIERVIATFDQAFFETHQGFGLDTEVPVFIVGMPRSGSTLVEQIVSSHPSAYGAGELNDMRLLIRRLPEMLESEQEEPECIASLSPAIAEKLAGEHLQKLRLLSGGADRVCDKMLGNFLKLGLIYLLFPRARIIHCMRNPLDMGLSCYSQNFARGLRFTYQLEHLGAAYRGYHKLMDHWRRFLPMRMLEVRYERVVTQQEQVSRELIEFCGLDWDQRCLDFHRQSRGVKTASFWQVRQPLYHSSVGQWRNYEQQLTPLVETLGDLLDEYSDRTD